MSSASDFFEILESVFSEAEDPENAASMSAYMRDKFSFYGIKSPQRKTIAKEIVKSEGLPDIEEWFEFGELCFGQNRKSIVGLYLVFFCFVFTNLFP